MYNSKNVYIIDIAYFCSITMLLVAWLHAIAVMENEVNSFDANWLLSLWQ